MTVPSSNGRGTNTRGWCSFSTSTKCRVNFTARLLHFVGVSSLVAVVEGLRILGHSGLRGQGLAPHLDGDPMSSGEPPIESSATTLLILGRLNLHFQF